MSIVFITIPGAQKTDFATELGKRVGESLKLVVVQKTRKVGWQERFRKLLKTVGWKNVLREFYYVLYIRLNKKDRKYLKYFFLRTEKQKEEAGVEKYFPERLEVDDINSNEVYEVLQKIKPKLIVVWGANILKPRIFKSADNAINLHMGIGECYRGAVANHFAVLEDKRESIGAMIHKIDENTDTGDVYKTLFANQNLPPKELFTNLNDLAFQELLDISCRLLGGENLSTTKQNSINSRNIFLREWTPSRRFQVAKKIKDWEDSHRK